ncbi:hypothetical protein ACHAO1_010945 [Botrytis cinerea]
MNTTDYFRYLEEVLGYHFCAKSMLEKVLTAPGAEGDKYGIEEDRIKYEGHRLLSTSGMHILPVLASRKRMISESNSGTSNIAKDALQCAVTAKDHVDRATALRLSSNLKLCPRQRGVAAPRTLQRTLFALIGAVWQDSGESSLWTEKAIRRLFIGTELPPQVDFRELTTDLENPERANPELSLLHRKRLLPAESTNQVPPAMTEILERNWGQLQLGQEMLPVQNSSAIDTPSKKQKTSTNSFKSRQLIQLDNYLEQEKQKCRAFGLSFIPMEIETVNDSQIPPGESDLAVKSLSLLIASPQSIVALQEIIKAHRASTAHKQFRDRDNFSLADRVKAIEDAESNIAYRLFLKRCHIHKLFIDCSKGSRRTSDGFVVDTVQSVSKQAGPRRGNPQNLDNAIIAEEIVKEVYPNLNPGTKLYAKKRVFIHRLRKLGERLDVLVKNFGYGILGLLAWPLMDSPDSPVLLDTDGM